MFFMYSVLLSARHYSVEVPHAGEAARYQANALVSAGQCDNSKVYIIHVVHAYIYAHNTSDYIPNYVTYTNKKSIHTNHSSLPNDNVRDQVYNVPYS